MVQKLLPVSIAPVGKLKRSTKTNTKNQQIKYFIFLRVEQLSIRLCCSFASKRLRQKKTRTVQFFWTKSRLKTPEEKKKKLKTENNDKSKSPKSRNLKKSKGRELDGQEISTHKIEELKKKIESRKTKCLTRKIETSKIQKINK